MQFPVQCMKYTLNPLIACLGPRCCGAVPPDVLLIESRYRTGYLHEAQWMVRPRRSTTVSIANLGKYFYLLDLRPATRPTSHVKTIPSTNSATIVTINPAVVLLAGFKNGYGYQPVWAPRIKLYARYAAG